MSRMAALGLTLILFLSEPAFASQQLVPLSDSQSSSTRGPLISESNSEYLVTAAFSKNGQKKGFRFSIKTNQTLKFSYLIADKLPENKLKITQLPQLVLTSPNGSKNSIKLNERNRYLDPSTNQNYFTLNRYAAPAQIGNYLFDITAKTKSTIFILISATEVLTPKPTPTNTKIAIPSPKQSIAPSELTMAKVRENNSEQSCWTAISGNVYDLTIWIGAHPGGNDAILSLCGRDGTSDFLRQHANQGRPESMLKDFLLGKLIG